MTIDELRTRTVITVPEAGEVFGLPRSSAYRAVAEGHIPSLRLGGRLVVPVPPLLRMLDADGNHDVEGTSAHDAA
jgi:excisionase family DNA binding protein